MTSSILINQNSASFPASQPSHLWANFMAAQDTFFDMNLKYLSGKDFQSSLIAFVVAKVNLRGEVNNIPRIEWVNNRRIAWINNSHSPIKQVVALSKLLEFLGVFGPQIKMLNLSCIIVAAGQKSLDFDELVNKCINLVHLKLQYSTITESISAPKNPKGILSIDFSCNDNGNEKAIKLTLLLPQFSSLKKLYLNHNSMGEVAAKALATNLKSVPLLEVLDISYNAITYAGAKDLAMNFQYIPLLQFLDLRANSIDCAATKTLAENLPFLKALKVLHLGSNSLLQMVVRISSIVASFQYTPLQELNISYNKMNSEGAVILAANFQYFKLLRSIDLTGNSIGDLGIDAIAKNSHHLIKLLKLYLGYNSIRKIEVGPLTTLKSHSLLNELNLEGNYIENRDKENLLMQFKHIRLTL